MPARKKSTTTTAYDTFFSRSYTPTLVILLIIASFFLGMLYTKTQYLEGNGVLGAQANPPTTPSPTKIVKPPAIGHLPPQGNPKAKIKIIEFADFRCPYCEKLYTESEQKIIADYVKTGKAVFYFRHFAFLGDPSILASNAAECANEQGKFWEMHNYFYDNQPPENDITMYTVENLTQVATNLGMDAEKFNSCLTSKKYQANVDKDYADGQTSGVSGTPATFINGQMIIGSQPYATFKAALDNAK